MSETQSSVTCPECEASFDPTAEGGWCTECGRFQALDVSGSSHPAEDSDATPQSSPAAEAAEMDADPTPPEATEKSDASPDSEAATSCPNCGETVETAWAACPFCATELPEQSDSDAPAAVVLEIGDRELTAPLGETVGREVRTAHVETGGSEQEAQYVHREHVRFERDNSEIIVINEGCNGATLNDQSLDVDEQAVVSDKDRLVFSDRVVATVHLP